MRLTLIMLTLMGMTCGTENKKDDVVHLELRDLKSEILGVGG